MKVVESKTQAQFICACCFYSTYFCEYATHYCKFTTNNLPVTFLQHIGGLRGAESEWGSAFFEGQDRPRLIPSSSPLCDRSRFRPSFCGARALMVGSKLGGRKVPGPFTSAASPVASPFGEPRFIKSQTVRLIPRALILVPHKRRARLYGGLCVCAWLGD